MGKLSETKHFLDLYMHMIGTNEVPRQWHLWSALSLLAACIQDRVWIRVDEVWKVYPNIYVMLVGASGSGKEFAVSTAQSFIPTKSRANKWAGTLTRPGMLEWLALSGATQTHGKGKHKVTTSTNPRCWFVAEELGAAIPSGDLGQALIALLTAIYVRPADYGDGNRQHGFLQLVRPCVNALLATTDEWLIRSIPKDAVEGGFIARMQVIRGERDYRVRYPEMLYPDDYAEVRDHLQRRVEDYLSLEEGEFRLDEEAKAVHHHWYRNQQPPSDSALRPAFNKADALIYKLSLLLALCEWPGREAINEEDGISYYDPVIRAHHVEEAISHWNWLVGDMPETMRIANANPQSNDVEVVREVVRSAGSMTRSVLQQKVGGSKGIVKERLDKALATLIDEEVVQEHREQGRGVRPKVWYTWEGGDR